MRPASGVLARLVGILVRLHDLAHQLAADDVLLAHDLVSKSQYPITVPLGRHANDQTFSFYFRSPSGFQVEIGWGGRPATHQSEYYTRDTYRAER